ncbi:MAG: CAP domain-containing protein [Spirochaetales bacterium]|jgi:uncharacterized protein YkwD|nr:CAP domain-containing protein [Spirochaetales bacterium]
MHPVKYILPALILILILILTLAISGCENTTSEDSAFQIDEIRAKWNQYKPTNTGSRYTQDPKAESPYEAGSLTQAHLDDGLNMTKFVRYLAGLSEAVYLDDSLNDQAQHGAVLLAAIDKLDHNPPNPGDMADDFYQKGKASCGSSNLYVVSNKYNLTRAEHLDRVVRTFIHDLSNIRTVGHRRWILHPSLQKLGFGLAERNQSGGMHAYYATMQIKDTSNTTDKVDMDYVSWPGKGYFPVDVFQGDEPWSVSLNPKVYDISNCQPVVTLTNVTTGQKWVFSVIGDTSVKLKFFYFNRESSGWPGCVIFRPDGLESMTLTENRLRNNTFAVTITGLVRKDGKSGSISYNVTFFEL